MSKEEIIKKANLIIENHREIDKMMVIEMVDLVQGLLDLYNKEKQKAEEYRIGWCNTGEELEKEKEKNKQLKKENQTQRSQLNSAFNNGFIHKDKIKEFANRIKTERDFWNKDEEAEWGQLNKYETYDCFYNNILELLKGE